MKSFHWLIIACCVCFTSATAHIDLDGESYFLESIGEQTVRRTDAQFKEKELTFQQQLDALNDQIFILKGEIQLMDMKWNGRKSR